MILARVRGLDQESRDLLTAAAVAGGEIDVELLDAIVPQARKAVTVASRSSSAPT